MLDKYGVELIGAKLPSIDVSCAWSSECFSKSQYQPGSIALEGQWQGPMGLNATQ